MGLPRDPIATDIRDLALGMINARGRIIFDSWPWDNAKIDEFTAPTPAASGIITFLSNVESIRALKAFSAGDTDAGTRVWNQDELLAAAQGLDVASDRFIYLADSATGCRRIQVDADAGTENTYKVLALKRYVDAVVDDDYDPAAPEDTPTDYRVATFVIDRAEPALRAQVIDQLRIWDGEAPTGEGTSLVALAHRRETEDQDREKRFNPRYPMFAEVGNWW